jgi:3-dehydroquinate dehydratase
VLIDALQDAFIKGGLGIILNPGAWTHYAYRLHDTLEMRTIPVVDTRRMGEGWQSYEQAFYWLIETN